MDRQKEAFNNLRVLNGSIGVLLFGNFHRSIISRSKAGVGHLTKIADTEYKLPADSIKHKVTLDILPLLCCVSINFEITQILYGVRGRVWRLGSSGARRGTDRPWEGGRRLPRTRHRSDNNNNCG